MGCNKREMKQMLLAVLSSEPFLNEWEMEFTCIISQHLGLAGPYLFYWGILFGGRRRVIYLDVGGKRILCV